MGELTVKNDQSLSG